MLQDSRNLVVIVGVRGGGVGGRSCVCCTVPGGCVQLGGCSFRIESATSIFSRQPSPGIPSTEINIIKKLGIRTYDLNIPTAFYLPGSLTSNLGRLAKGVRR